MNEKLENESLQLRMNSVSESTLKSRRMQWNSYLEACNKFGWVLLPCEVQQACSYVDHLSRRLAFTSILAYYEAIIVFHPCEGLTTIHFANPVLRATLNGIMRLGSTKGKGKDPLLLHHLTCLSRVANFDVDLEMLVFVTALLMFRTLLRVSHVITSERNKVWTEVIT